MALEKEDIVAITEAFRTATPPVQVRERMLRDHDSFASFTNGLRENWIFLMALMAVGMWFYTNVSQNNITNVSQNKDISSLETNQQILTATFDKWKQEETTNSAEIVRRLDNLQKDVEIIKGSK